jgi:hypothetical protein
LLVELFTIALASECAVDTAQKYPSLARQANADALLG